MKQILHTPEGVRDITNIECGKKLTIEKEINEVFRLYGYHSIQTPTFEYYKVFGKEIGTIDSKELYKFFDRDGETLVLRPDLTPGVARAAATIYAKEDLPIRLCYTGNTYINHTQYQGRLKENTQVGVELIGWNSYMADAEVIALSINSILSVGLKEFQISLGNAGFYNGIMKNLGLRNKEIDEITDYISNRNYFGLESYLESLKVSKDVIKTIMTFDELSGDVEILKKASSIAKSEESKDALKRLSKIYETLKIYDLDQYISFDLSMSGGAYHYYTGIIFRGYTRGVGDAIVRGGRYDNLIEKFGKKSPSIGFGIVIDEVLSAISRQKINSGYKRENMIILFEKEDLEDAIKRAEELRKEGIPVELLEFAPGKSLDDYISYGNEYYAKGIIYKDENKAIKRIEL